MGVGGLTARSGSGLSAVAMQKPLVWAVGAVASVQSAVAARQPGQPCGPQTVIKLNPRLNLDGEQVKKTARSLTPCIRLVVYPAVRDDLGPRPNRSKGRRGKI